MFCIRRLLQSGGASVLPGWGRHSGILSAWLLGLAMAQGNELESAREQYWTGDYRGAIARAETALQEPGATEPWRELLIQGLLQTGQYPEACAAATNALARYPHSAVLQWLTHEALQQHGETEAASALALQLARNALLDPRAYRDARSLVVVGRALLLQGVDPKQILDKVFDAAKKADPAGREVYLASGELALEKGDYALAAQVFQEGLKALPADADLQFGLARAYAPSEPVLALEALEAALERNSNHVGSLLLLADRKIDAEAYEDADPLLDSVHAVNPSHPELWAYRAVIAHLRNEPDLERAAREQALAFWPTNPRVDYLMGLKLSQKYRFREGADHQMQALKLAGNYEPAPRP